MGSASRARAVILAAALAWGGARADDFETLIGALQDTRPLVDLRVRSETLAQNGSESDAEALLLRGRLGAQTGQAWDTSLLAEGSFLTPLVDDYYNGLGAQGRYPYVGDPESYELHRLQLENTSLPDTRLIVGRQRVGLDDFRFIGPSNWRMTENTLNSARLINTSVPDVTIDLTYFDRFNRRIDEASTRVGPLTGNSYLANVAYQSPWGKLTAFDYVLSFNETPLLSSRTAGLRWTGEQSLSVFKLAYTASWAEQGDHANNPLAYSAAYYYLDMTGSWRQYSLNIGAETLGGNGRIGLSTPLASFHSWDGWAGAFTTTPVNGLEARYATVGYQARAPGPLDSLQASARAYDFRAQRLDERYGSEVDLQVQAALGHISGLVSAADYAAAPGSATHSSRSLWVEIDYVL